LDFNLHTGNPGVKPLIVAEKNIQGLLSIPRYRFGFILCTPRVPSVSLASPHVAYSVQLCCRAGLFLGL